MEKRTSRKSRAKSQESSFYLCSKSIEHWARKCPCLFPWPLLLPLSYLQPYGFWKSPRSGSLDVHYYYRTSKCGLDRRRPALPSLHGCRQPSDLCKTMKPSFSRSSVSVTLVCPYCIHKPQCVFPRQSVFLRSELNKLGQYCWNVILCSAITCTASSLLARISKVVAISCHVRALVAPFLQLQHSDGSLYLMLIVHS